MGPAKTRPLLTIGLFLAGILPASGCWAQMFGARSVGQPLGRRAAPQSSQTGETQGTLQGTERFLRENRSGDQFVGRDSGEGSGFVGQVIAGDQTINVPTATGVIIRPDLSNLVNRPVRPRLPNGLLDPPLTLAFQPDPETIARHAEKARRSIARSLSVPFENPIEVSVVNRTAILRGVVRDEAQVRLAGTIALMEPGISEVRNDLRALIVRTGDQEHHPHRSR